VLLVNLLQSAKARQKYAQQTEKSYSHKNSVVSLQVYIHALLAQHLYSVFFQYMVWHGPTSETASMQRKQKNWLKHTDFTELKKITSRIHSTVRIIIFFFSSPQISLLFVLFHWKKFATNCTSVLLILLLCSAYFTFVCCLFCFIGHFSMES